MVGIRGTFDQAFEHLDGWIIWLDKGHIPFSRFHRAFGFLGPILYRYLDCMDKPIILAILVIVNSIPIS